jgi:excisionase family DNA binding protein
MPTAYRKEVLTTGEVARICHVAPRTVSKWFDTGKLRGYRIPGSRDRRIPLQQLLAFMRAHGIPLDGLDGGVCRVLVLDRGSPSELLDAMNAMGRYNVRSAAGGFQAGVLAEQFRPHVIVLDADGDVEEAAAICRNIRANENLQAVKLIAAVRDAGPRQRQDLLAKGFDDCLCKPIGAEGLVAAVEKATNLIT